MDYKQKYKEALERTKEWMTGKYGHYVSDTPQEIAEFIFPELKESEDEQIRKELLEHCINRRDGKQVCVDANDYRRWADWLEKQGQSKKTSIWKHWKDGIAGNGNDIPVFLIKNGLTYSLSSCLSFECDYIELSELDSLMLEKQGEQKPFDCENANIQQKDFVPKVKPKFNVRDWIIHDIGDGRVTPPFQIIEMTNKSYVLDNGKCFYFSDTEELYRKWTIEDAKNGDVLCLGYVIAIFKKYIGQEKCICYCSFCDNGEGFEIPIENGEDNVYGCTDTTPATKEQRDLLFAKMHEAGYEWDADKRELTKK